MDITMGKSGVLFVAYLKEQLRLRKGRIDNYKDTMFAEELGVEYGTLKRWLSADAVERIDLENFLALQSVFGEDFTRYLLGKK